MYILPTAIYEQDPTTKNALCREWHRTQVYTAEGLPPAPLKQLVSAHISNHEFHRVCKSVPACLFKQGIWVRHKVCEVRQDSLKQPPS